MGIPYIKFSIERKFYKHHSYNLKRVYPKTTSQSRVTFIDETWLKFFFYIYEKFSSLHVVDPD